MMSLKAAYAITDAVWQQKSAPIRGFFLKAERRFFSF